MFDRACGIGFVTRSDRSAVEAIEPLDVARLGDAVELSRWLQPERLRGRKAAELDVWLRAVTERRAARAEGRPARMDAVIAEFRSAREYRPGRLPAQSPRGPAQPAATLAALRKWADREPGALSSNRYAAAREPGWPTRNTITRRFGSWDAALQAAGLGDRVASAPEAREARRSGGAAKREARAEAQRRRVLKTLRFAVNVDGYGTLPTAMQFFRWRLINAPATPTQATVYRLFPGGWPAVLAAYETWGGQPSRA